MMKILFQLLGLLAAVSISNAAPAPDWSLQDAEGNTVRFGDYRGKPLILHFWATWCPYCKKVQPGLDRLYLRYKDQGLELLGVSWWEDEGAEPQQTLDARGMHFKTLLNGDIVAKRYRVKGTPATFFIDRNGDITLKTGSSDPDDPQFEKAILQILRQTESPPQ